VKPYLRVVRGQASAEEIAAVVAVLATRESDVEPPAVQKVESWRNPARGMRKPVVPGRFGWRNSGLP